MRRREFIAATGAAAVWPLAARAQQDPRMRRVAVVHGLNDGPEAQARTAAFRQTLDALGWIEGRNVEIVVRFGAGDPDRNAIHVAETLAQAPDVVISPNPNTVAALMSRTLTTPIVFPQLPDPVALGFVQSFARPGGNVTGFTHFDPTTATKWLELLREVSPGVVRVALLVDPGSPTGALYTRALETAAQAQRIQLTILRATNTAEVEQVIDAFARLPNGGLIIPTGPRVTGQRVSIMQTAAKHRLPVVYPFRYIVLEGGLMSYGPDILDLWRRTAGYVDRIFKGAKPAELPVQNPTKFQLVFNLKTAKAIGLTIPESFLLRADEVIE